MAVMLSGPARGHRHPTGIDGPSACDTLSCEGMKRTFLSCHYLVGFGFESGRFEAFMVDADQSQPGLDEDYPSCFQLNEGTAL